MGLVTNLGAYVLVRELETVRPHRQIYAVIGITRYTLYLTVLKISHSSRGGFCICVWRASRMLSALCLNLQA